MAVTDASHPHSAEHLIARIGLVQHACGGDPEANLARTVAGVREAAGRGARLVVTQELCHLPYFPQTEDPASFRFAETIPGPTSRRLGDLAGELGIVLVAALFERRAAGVHHNTAIVLDGTSRGAARLVGCYRKMHVPDDPRFYEKYYFAPGDTGWPVWQTPAGVAGVLICWDQWFPEAARLAALRGAQILFYPTAIAWSADESAARHAEQREAWLVVQRAHAIANGVFVAAVNRTGVEGALRFWGSSFVADPTGRVIAEAGIDADGALVVDCDLAQIDAWRRDWPFMRDRRIDAYGDLTRRWLDGTREAGADA